MCRGAPDYVGWLLAECDGCVYLPVAFARLLRDELWALLSGVAAQRADFGASMQQCLLLVRREGCRVMVRSCQFFGVVLLCGLLSSGCTKSSAPAPAKTPGGSSTSQAEGTGTGTTAANNAAKKSSGYWEDFPDVPKIEIMTEVGGIPIPRMPANNETLSLTGPIPADVDNEWAKQRPSEPVTGDSITIRFNAEPKVLNPITETSAVQTYIMQYVNEGLARQNPETFEFEPGIAKKWVVEDSVKLSPDYPGRERRVALKEGPAQISFEIDYEVAAPVGGKPADPKKITLVTSGKDGQPLGGAWVGIYPVGRILGASTTGYHYWSDEKGQLEVSGFPAGKYVVKTGDELFGQAERQEDGGLIVKPGTDENPLKETLTLKKGEWQDVQEKTYTTFYLRDDVKWSDGVPFTTKDIEFGYALLNSPYVDGDSIRTYYSDLVECTSLGTHVVRLRYRQQYFKAPEFSYGISAFTPPLHFFEAIFKEQGRELTLAALTPEEETAKKMVSARGQEFGKFFNTDDRYNRKPLGTGPYIVDKWERGDRVELVRNPNYWYPAKAGHLDRIIVKFIIDQVSAMAAMKAGEIDFFYDMSAEQFFEDWPTLDKTTQETYVRGLWFSPMFSYIGWNQLAALSRIDVFGLLSRCCLTVRTLWIRNCMVPRWWSRELSTCSARATIGKFCPWPMIPRRRANYSLMRVGLTRTTTGSWTRMVRSFKSCCDCPRESRSTSRCVRSCRRTSRASESICRFRPWSGRHLSKNCARKNVTLWHCGGRCLSKATLSRYGTALKRHGRSGAAIRFLSIVPSRMN